MNMIHRTISTLRQLVLSLVVLCFASNAFAHAKLEKSIPAANAVVNKAPPELVLEFDKPTKLMNLSLTDKMTGKAENVNSTVNSKTEKTHKLLLPKLANGHYSVNWTAMGEDGHIVSGEFAFVIGAVTEAKHEDMKGPSDTDHSGE